MTQQFTASTDGQNVAIAAGADPTYTVRVHGVNWRPNVMLVLENETELAGTQYADAEMYYVKGSGEWQWYPDDTSTPAAGSVVQITSPVTVATGRYKLRSGSTIRTILTDGTSVAVSGVISSPGIVVDSGSIRIWYGDETDADVSLSSDASTSVLSQVMLGLNPSSHYLCTFGFRVNMWDITNPLHSGSIDGYADLYVTTSPTSVATAALQTALVVDSTRMHSSMAGADAAMAPVTGGIEIFATRPTGMSCRCSCAWWVTEFKEMSVVS